LVRDTGSQGFQGSADYLSLLAPENLISGLIERLRKAPTVMREAKDLLRASQTYLLEADNSHVVEDLKRIKKGRKLSPVLLIRGHAPHGITLTIADGYHRICASWHWNEDELVACRLADFAPPRNKIRPTLRAARSLRASESVRQR
jgi:hypothetical protein